MTEYKIRHRSGRGRPYQGDTALALTLTLTLAVCPGIIQGSNVPTGSS